jgi:hypothetical protein
MEGNVEGGTQLVGLEMGDRFTLPNPALATKSGIITEGGSIIWNGGATIVVNVGILTVWEKGGKGIVACDYTNGAHMSLEILFQLHLYNF